MPFHRDSLGLDGDAEIPSGETKLNSLKEGKEAKNKGLSKQDNPYISGDKIDPQKAMWWEEGFNAKE